MGYNLVVVFKSIKYVICNWITNITSVECYNNPHEKLSEYNGKMQIIELMDLEDKIPARSTLTKEIIKKVRKFYPKEKRRMLNEVQ